MIEVVVTIALHALGVCHAAICSVAELLAVVALPPDGFGFLSLDFYNQMADSTGIVNVLLVPWEEHLYQPCAAVPSFEVVALDWVEALVL